MILPFQERIFPQILKVSIFTLGVEVDNIESARNPTISREVLLVGIVTYLLKDLKRTVGFGHELGLPLGWESLFP